jgi:glycerol-3-phosphate dehydrogenase
MHEIKGKVIINATGVFADEIIKLDNVESKSLIRPSQGIHLVLDQSFLKSKDSIMIPHTDDGRVLFAIPWYDKVIVGTTDTPLNSHSIEPRALKSEVDFILETAGKYLTRQPERKDVLSVFAGLRPLAATDVGNEKTKEISRSHKVIVSDSGLVSVIGGKWTTYRKMAEDTLDKVMKRKMLPEKECVTMNLKIHGYSISDQPHKYAFDLWFRQKRIERINGVQQRLVRHIERRNGYHDRPGNLGST